MYIGLVSYSLAELILIVLKYITLEMSLSLSYIYIYISHPRREASAEPNLPTFDLGLPASRTVRKYIFVVKFPSLWYFVMAAD